MGFDIAALLTWYHQESRQLPWRSSDVSPWKILVSEVMLQQTPVSRVMPVWIQWVDRWPNPQLTAQASLAQLLRAWGNLGYPRRAVRLHECAIQITDHFQGTVPCDIKTLQQLPGVGVYTAHAVACFGYGLPVPVVDTNVARVISRVIYGQAYPLSSSSQKQHRDAAQVIPKNISSCETVKFFTALMELGALICLARKPACSRCPISVCQWRNNGFPASEKLLRPAQPYWGTNRHARGQILKVLRTTPPPVHYSLLVPSENHQQHNHALQELVREGLIHSLADNHFCLPGDSPSEQ